MLEPSNSSESNIDRNMANDHVPDNNNVYDLGVNPKSYTEILERRKTRRQFAFLANIDEIKESLQDFQQDSEKLFSLQLEGNLAKASNQKQTLLKQIRALSGMIDMLKSVTNSL